MSIEEKNFFMFKGETNELINQEDETNDLIQENQGTINEARKIEEQKIEEELAIVRGEIAEDINNAEQPSNDFKSNESKKTETTEYQYELDSLNLIKEGLDSEVFKNNGEVFGTDVVSVLESELKVKPLNCDIYSGIDYDEDKFFDDTVRLPNLSMIVEVAHSEMELKLNQEMNERINKGDIGAKAWYKKEMKNLWENYRKADAEISIMINNIEKAFKVAEEARQRKGTFQ